MNETLTYWAEMLLKDRNLFIFDWLFSLILSFIKFIDYKHINQRKTNHRFNLGGIDILPSLRQLLTQVKGVGRRMQPTGEKLHDENDHLESPPNYSPKALVMADFTMHSAELSI